MHAMTAGISVVDARKSIAASAYDSLEDKADRRVSKLLPACAQIVCIYCGLFVKASNRLFMSTSRYKIKHEIYVVKLFKNCRN
jgi:hypothetical protein